MLCDTGKATEFLRPLTHLGAVSINSLYRHRIDIWLEESILMAIPWHTISDTWWSKSTCFLHATERKYREAKFCKIWSIWEVFVESIDRICTGVGEYRKWAISSPVGLCLDSSILWKAGFRWSVGFYEIYRIARKCRNM